MVMVMVMIDQAKVNVCVGWIGEGKSMDGFGFDVASSFTVGRVLAELLWRGL